MAKPKLEQPTCVVFVGGPDTGKTNYLVRLFVGLTEKTGVLIAPELPPQIAYLEAGRKHLAQGRFVPRSGAEKLGDLFARVEFSAGRRAGESALVQVPDVMGELWKDAVDNREIDPAWLKRVRNSTGALLFVRPSSHENVDFLDWVTAADWMNLEPGDGAPEKTLPSQVIATELLTLLEDELGSAVPGAKPRVAIIATSWDAVPPDRRDRAPYEFLNAEFPMFAGRILDTERLEVMVFGCSVVGGDLQDDADFRIAYRDMEIETAGYVVVGREDGSASQLRDVTLPLAWSLGAELPGDGAGG